MGTSKEIGEKRIGAADIGMRDLPDLSRWGEVEAVELSTVRRLIAQSPAVSWQTLPHVTQFEEADVTHLEEFIGAHAEKSRQTGGKLTIIAVIIKICAAALKRFPQFNAAIDTANNRIVYRKYVHIGMDVDTERGLVVPVIRNADKKSISDLAREIVDLSERTRNKKIKPDELEGGGFTVSNQGGIGGTQFTPIVLWPQAAIIGISRASVVPRYIEGGFEPRTVLPLAFSYDHRIADCADAARFLRWVQESIEQPMTIFL
jgi:pyruvate dehydrogenase E2 component (dihydrolipoamide acetyltransferase)